MTFDVGAQGVPDMLFSPLSYTDTLQEGSSVIEDLIIWNNGTAELTVDLEAIEFSLLGGEGENKARQISIPVTQSGSKGSDDPPEVLNIWLFVSPSSANIPADDSLVAEVTLDATSLGAGMYLGQVNLTSNDPDTPTGTIPVTLVVEGTGGQCNYVVGDANASDSYNGLDITYGVAYFKGGPPPPYECECTPGNTWYVGGDVNASCSYNGLDITYGVAYFKGGPDPMPCSDCPPGRISGRILKVKPVDKGATR